MVGMDICPQNDMASTVAGTILKGQYRQNGRTYSLSANAWTCKTGEYCESCHSSAKTVDCVTNSHVFLGRGARWCHAHILTTLRKAFFTALHIALRVQRTSERRSVGGGRLRAILCRDSVGRVAIMAASANQRPDIAAASASAGNVVPIAGSAAPALAAGLARKDLYEVGEIPPLGHVPSKMYAWAIRKDRHGPPDQAMQVEVLPTWELDSHDVLVLVMAAGVNYNGVWASLGKPISTLDGHKWPYHIAGWMRPASSMPSSPRCSGGRWVTSRLLAPGRGDDEECNGGDPMFSPYSASGAMRRRRLVRAVLPREDRQLLGGRSI